MSISIKDVAREAGVNISTASRVLNQVPGKWATDKTRKRIIKAAEKLSYRPSHYARSMRSGKTNIMGLLVPDLLNPLFAELTEEIRTLLLVQGKHLVVEDSGGIQDREINGILNLIAMKVDGLIVVPMHAPSLEKAVQEGIANQKKIVMVSNNQFPQVTHVWVDRSKAFTAIFEHLKKRNRKKILFIKASIDNQSPEENELILKQALKAGYTKGSIQIEYSNSTPEGGQVLIQKYFRDSKKNFDAVICSSDTTMLGVHSQLVHLGFSLPQDLSLVTGDDTYLCRWLVPPISSIASSVKTLALQTVKSLLDPAQSKSQKKKKQFVIPEFTIRASS